MSLNVTEPLYDFMPSKLELLLRRKKMENDNLDSEEIEFLRQKDSFRENYGHFDSEKISEEEEDFILNKFCKEKTKVTNKAYKFFCCLFFIPIFWPLLIIAGPILYLLHRLAIKKEFSRIKLEYQKSIKEMEVKIVQESVAESERVDADFKKRREDSSVANDVSLEMIEKGDYELVQNYARKHVLENDSSYETNIDIFSQILSKRGYFLTKQQIKFLIYDVAFDLSVDDHCKRIGSDNVNSLEELMRNHIDFIENSNQEMSDEISNEIFKTIAFQKGYIDLSEDIELMLGEAKKKFEVEDLENSIGNNSQENQINIGHLDYFTGYEFEKFLEKLFVKIGYEVFLTKLSNDQGADLILKKHHETVVVQAKRYNDTVGNKAIQEVIASIRHYNANRAMVVTTNYFTNSAIRLAESNDVELVDRDKLGYLIQKYY